MLTFLKTTTMEKNKQELLNFMDKFKLGFGESTTKVGFQLDHIRANVLEIECEYNVT